MGNKEKRISEFLECLGNGKSIYECESENERIDEELEESEN
jgi:hypothetical protein